ncbi:MAG: hypothetical protein KatS3mg102_0612 [Planctomycetota bacterium]|nr:MAG: hypothetical protein KatS3mg102_0612 [Planctomycetota bacterium]
MAGAGEQHERELFGVRAIKKGYATEEQVLAALRAQYNAKVLLGRHLFLGEVLLLHGVLSPRQLAELLRETGELHEEAEDVHSGRFFGDVAVELGFCTPQQVFTALNIQAEEDRRGERHRLIGEILFELGYLSAEQVRQVVAHLVDRMQEPVVSDS